MRETGGAAGMSGSGMLMIGAAIAVVIGIGAYFGMRDSAVPSQEELSALVPQADSSAPAEGAEMGEETPAAPEATTDQAPTESVTEAEQPPEQPASAIAVLTPPTIDEVRVEADGLIIVAGRADAGSLVRVLVDGEDAAQAPADSRGSFAALGSVGPSNTARIVSLIAEKDGQVVASLDEVILAPIAPPVTAPDVAVPVPETSPLIADVPADPTPDAAASVVVADVAQPADTAVPAAQQEATPEQETAPVEAETQTVEAVEQSLETDQQTDQDVPDPVASAPVIAQSDETLDVGTAMPAPVIAALPNAPAQPEVTTVETPAITPPQPTQNPAVAVLKSTSEGVSLLQTAPTPTTSITLDTIGYSDSGVVQLAGRASVQTEGVNIYLDNRAVLSLPVDENGAWRGEVPDVAAGVYRLRVDAVDAAGKVTSRLQTPFKREAPAALAQAAQGQDGPVKAITVQTGDTLWAIARDRYGEGVLYVRVFDANRASISDPDLIYPGQVFDLPGE